MQVISYNSGNGIVSLCCGHIGKYRGGECHGVSHGLHDGDCDHPDHVVTREDVATLEREARIAGDDAMARIAARALWDTSSGYWTDSERLDAAESLRECRRVIVATRMAQD